MSREVFPSVIPVDHPIALSPGFNPQALPDGSPHVPGVRPWPWLQATGTPAEAVADYLTRFVRGHGTVDPSDRDLLMVPRGRDEVISGFLSQEVLFEFIGAPSVRVRLTSGYEDPATGGSGAGGPSYPRGDTGVALYPFGGPVAIVGTTAPVGVAAFSARRRLHEELADFLVGRGIGVWEATAVDVRREWVEHALLVEYSRADSVRTAAAVHFQPFITVWRPPIEADPTGSAERASGPGILEVIGLADPLSEEVLASAPASLVQLSERTCPLIPGSGCGDLCRLNGGPWISRSITAAARWESRRARMIRALGCDTCGDGAIKVFQDQVWSGRRNAIPGRPDDSTPTRHDRLVARDVPPAGTTFPHPARL